MAGPVEFKGDLTCVLECSDLDAGIAWYVETLGFELLYKVEDIGWAELKSPVENVQVGISQVEKPGAGAGGATLTFGVVDVDAARGAIESRGVRFDGDTQTIPNMVRLATFFDPDGNKLMFAQSL